MNWYIGQRVFYKYENIEGHIAEILICPKCGTVHLTLQELPSPPLSAFGCSGKCWQLNTGMMSICIGSDESEFRPLEENFAERVLSEAIESAKEVEILIETYKEEKV